MVALPIRLDAADEWLADLDEPLRALLNRAEDFASGFGDPPTERQFADALNAIRDARWRIRDARRLERRAIRIFPLNRALQGTSPDPAEGLPRCART